MTTDPPKPDGDESGASPDSSDDRATRSGPLRLGRLAAVGAELGLVVAALTLGGWWLDGLWSTSPWLTLAGAFIGIVGGLYKFWRLGRELTHRPDR